MIDVDLVKLLPNAYEDFCENFKLSGILPGGKHCMFTNAMLAGAIIELLPS